MKELTKISESEYEVMEVLWETDDWMDVSTVHKKLSQGKKWVYNTVGTFMIRLTEKGFLKTEKRGRSNFYFPLVQEKEYLRFQTEAFLNSIHKGSKQSLIAALYEDDLSDEELKKLMDLVEKR